MTDQIVCPYCDIEQETIGGFIAHLKLLHPTPAAASGRSMERVELTCPHCHEKHLHYIDIDEPAATAGQEKWTGEKLREVWLQLEGYGSLDLGWNEPEAWEKFAKAINERTTIDKATTTPAAAAECSCGHSRNEHLHKTLNFCRVSRCDCQDFTPAAAAGQEKWTPEKVKELTKSAESLWEVYEQVADVHNATSQPTPSAAADERMVELIKGALLPVKISTASAERVIAAIGKAYQDCAGQEP